MITERQLYITTIEFLAICLYLPYKQRPAERSFALPLWLSLVERVLGIAYCDKQDEVPSSNLGRGF